MSGHMKRSGYKQSNVLYRLVVDAGHDITTILSINNINGFQVKLEKMNKSTIVQCRRCQRFQHAAKSFFFHYRCVQFAGNHQPGCCPRIANKKLPLQCINCVTSGFKNINHTANNLNSCEFFQTKHSNLFQKHQSAVKAANNVKTNKNIGKPKINASNQSGGSSPNVNNNQPSTNARVNDIIETVLANNPNARNVRNNIQQQQQQQQRVNVPDSKLVKTFSVNKSKRRKNTRGDSAVHSGKSSTVCSATDRAKIDALAGALFAIVQQFLNAS